ncbi:NAD+ synthase [Methylotuvimicrobium alcaliphilum]|uniref:Glutamine-dependent NAD(+) synthetase n=1 Tax=Methylotuvimicrobium alcaliphilum (strain DSM 19304 / NCIMB 14124 / VKM B-2133 / 20Z) TaxID=1091494 RepID=G4T2T6_META2|nr:NAD+ synthase [Methylotuvimicrobium alcaliphilum]CCE22570.1 glutamine-dependent NAD(+) synthetase (NAD(+) synthase [glutamine-hydrolyzing]) (NadE) [Methylotuvimicrobium alcaliphilum 20Z]
MSATTLRIAIAQSNFRVGDIKANTEKIIAQALDSRDRLKADIVIFPELSVTGYPPEDLLLRPDFIARAQHAATMIVEQVQDIDVVFGYPEQSGGKLFNSAVVCRSGEIIARYHKNVLPNYGVFDEQRYFTAGSETALFNLKGLTLALTICEDVWQSGLIAKNRQAGADIVLTLNASPFHAGKIHQREQVVCDQVKAAGVPLVYVNLIGGQDELVFDGASFVVDSEGSVVFRAEEFREQLSVVEFAGKQPIKSICAPIYRPVSSEYQALVLGIRDYVSKNGFNGALLGLSGGIDSALVLALAVDALGADKVEAVLMPSRYTQAMSNEDAESEANALGVNYHMIPIEPAVTAFNEMLAPVFAGSAKDTTEENIQARCRGVLLMALSNKQGKLLLTTGNKSEMSVGYATLYGDMAGGFAPIKDVPKLLVYALARYRNSISKVIPDRVITRPPSAELAPDQVDQDSLPPYEVLDPILERYVEFDQSADEIIAAGFAAEHVVRAITLVDRNEYKRRQSPPGIRITPRAFGRDRRYPITSGYKGI